MDSKTISVAKQLGTQLDPYLAGELQGKAYVDLTDIAEECQRLVQRFNSFKHKDFDKYSICKLLIELDVNICDHLYNHICSLKTYISDVIEAIDVEDHSD